MRPGRLAQPATVLMIWSAVVLVWSVTGHHGLEGTAVRTVVFGSFLLAGPGLAFVLLVRITDTLLAIVVSVGLSCALLVLAAQVSLYSGWWSPFGVVEAITGLTLAVSAFCVFRPDVAAHTVTPQAHDD
jgi:hypothetical protein